MAKKQPFYLFSAFFILYELTTYLSNDMNMPSMPQIVGQFHASLDKVALSLTYYIIGGSLLQVFLAPLADYFGKRKILLPGILLFLIATVIIPFSSSINEFLLARFFQGMGMCFIFIGYAMVHELLDDVAAVKLIAIFSSIALLAPLAGPLLGTVIVYISRWEFIFLVSGILGIISFFGLYKYMPPGEVHTETINIRQIIKSYKNIFTNKIFINGIVAYCLSVVPLLAWIGISPTIILEAQHQSFIKYAIYQLCVFSGYIVSSFVINRVAGKYSFYKLISYGGTISFLGLICAGGLSFVNLKWVIFGMMIYALGIGIYSGSLIRISLRNTGESMNLSSASMTLINGVVLFIGIESVNKISQLFNYSIQSFAISNLIIAIPVFLLIMNFARIHKNLKWS